MKKTVRKLVTGTLICAMAATATPMTNASYLGKVAMAKVNEEFGYSISTYGNDQTRYSDIGLMKGCPTKLVVEVEGTEEPKFTYTIEDTSIVTIDAEGNITPHEVGETGIIIKEEVTGTTIERVVSVVERYICGEMSYQPLENARFRFIKLADYTTIKRVCIPYSINGAIIATIGERACADFDNVRVISVPNGTETIESEAFADNASLEYVMIPSSVTNIADDIFGTEPLEKKVTLLGHEGSEAEKFALEHKDQVVFKAIDKNILNYHFLWDVSFENVTGAIELLEGDSYQLKVKLIPENTSETISYRSSDEEVVTVTEDGFIKAVGAGEAVVTVEGENGLGLVANVVVDKKAEVTTTPEVTTSAAVTTTPEVTTSAAVATTPAVATSAAVATTPAVTTTAVVASGSSIAASAEKEEPISTNIPAGEGIRPTATPTIYDVAEDDANMGLGIPMPTFNAIEQPLPETTVLPTIAQGTAVPEVPATNVETTATPVAGETQDTTGNSVVAKAGNIIAATIEKMTAKEEATQDTSLSITTKTTTTDNTKKKKTTKEVEVDFETTPTIKITTKKSKKMVVGKKYTMKAKISSDKKIKWMVSNEKIATINKNTGVLKVKKAGKVTVYAICDGAKAKITFVIKK